MSMLFELRQVTKDEMESLLRDPSDISFFLYGSEPDEPPQGFFRKLLGKRTPPRPKREWQAPASDMQMELHKNWHILHYIFCRQPWDGPLPAATLLHGGAELGEVDVGYGPARLLNHEEVEKFSNYLHALEKDRYASSITREELEENEIYVYSEEWAKEFADDLWDYVEELQAFFKNASSRGHGIVLYLY